MQLKPGPNGATGLPAPFSDFQTNTFDGDLHRASWDWVGAQHGEPLDRRREHVQQERVFAERRSGLGETRCASRTPSTATRTWGSSPSPSSARGAASSYNGTKQPRFTVKDDVTFIKGSHTIKTGFTYDRQQANGFGQQDYGGRAGFDFKQTGVPGVTNFTTAGGSSFASFLLGYAQLRPNRDDSLPAAGVSVLRVLRAGRLAHERQVRAELRRALRVHAAAGRGRRSVLGARSDQAESGRQRLSRRVDLRRRGRRARRQCEA